MLTDLSEYYPYQDGEKQGAVLLQFPISCLRLRCPSCLMLFVMLPPVQQSHMSRPMAPVSLNLQATMGQSQAKWCAQALLVRASLMATVEGH